MTVHGVIKLLESTTKKNDKLAILKEHADNPILRDFFRLALHPHINFYQKKDFVQRATGDVPIVVAMRKLEKDIAGRQITGNAAIEYIQELIDSVSPEYADLICRILKKKPGCGVDTQANDIWDGIAPEFPQMLASPFTQKAFDKYYGNQKSYIVQLKSDGTRTFVTLTNGTVTLNTRSGREIEVNNHFDSLLSTFPSDFVVDCELLAIDPNTGKFLPRKIGNGIINKAVKGTISQDEIKYLHLVAWDMIPLDSYFSEKYDLPYCDRLAMLSSFVEKNPYKNLISLIESKVVYSQREVNEFFQKKLSDGEEGAMLKRIDGIWENKRVKDTLKLKSEKEGEFRVVSFNEGKGELLGNLGSLNLETDDNKVKVSVSGFSLKLRSEIYANLTGAPVEYQMMNKETDSFETLIANPGDCDIGVGSVVTVRYNELICDVDKNYSLFLPRFVCLREDKDSTDTLETLK
jgi:ATP-dependent DNA ligase